MDCQATSSLGFTQSDLAPVSWPAQRLLPPQRQDLAVQVLAGAETVSELARQHEVSRKFLYQQAHTAEQALGQAFAPTPKPDEVLFYLPVTRAWLRQLVLALVLICHSSCRGVVEFLRDIFDYPISLGTVHNIVHNAVPPAQRINQQYNLSTILVGAHDEIFQAADPVLVGVDTASTFCYLLSLEDHRDADTWGVRLLELVDRGFAPEATIADFASGLPPGTRRLCPGFPAAVMFFMLCTKLGRWSVTWRTGPTRPSRPGPSSSESKPLPNGGRAGRNRLWSRSYGMHVWQRPKRSRWLMRSRYWPAGCGKTS